MMPILHSPGVMTPGQLGPISRVFEPDKRALDLHHILHRDAFGDAHDQRDFGRDRLQDRIGGKGRRHIDHGCIGARAVHRIGNGIEHRQVEMRRSAFARRHAADHFRAVGDRLFGMERALRAR